MRLRIFCRPRGQHMVCSAAYLCLQSVGNLFGNLAFDAKYVRQLAIIGVGPKMSISCRSYELDIDANLLAGLLDASFQDIRDAKLLGDLRNNCGAAFFSRAKSFCNSSAILLATALLIVSANEGDPVALA